VKPAWGPRGAVRDDAVFQLVADVCPRADRGQDRVADSRRDAREAGSLATDARWSVPAIPPATPLWTDDFSNILGVLSLNPR
jgi:hypothetical protein